MSNYTKSTNFATKDGLASGNPLKVIKGTEIDDEFEAIETAIATKADTTNLSLSSWSITESSGSLIFSYGGTAKFKLTSTGAITVVDDVTAFGTI